MSFFRKMVLSKKFNTTEMKSDIDSVSNLKKQLDVPIIATIGENGWQKIDNFYASGARIFRINGSHVENEKVLQNTLKNANDILKKYSDASLMYDTQGAEIRILINCDKNKGCKDCCYHLHEDDMLAIHTNLGDEEICFSCNTQNNNTITVGEKQIFHLGVNYEKFIFDVNIGNTLTIDGGLVDCTVSTINYEKGIVFLRVNKINLRDKDYTLTDRRHVNLHGMTVSQPTLTEYDKKYIKISVLNDVKYLAVSFVRCVDDIIFTRKLVKDAFLQTGVDEQEAEKRANEVEIIAKFETKQGMKNLNEIMQVADGSMIARGDLANEISPEQVPYAKQQIISATRIYKDKICILATDVLKNLSYEYIPSRNDIDVITTSLMMGVNSLMLSDETAVSDFGCQAIEIMANCISFFRKKTIKSYYKWYFTGLQKCIYFKPLKYNDKMIEYGFYKFYIKRRKKQLVEFYLMAIFGVNCFEHRKANDEMFVLERNTLWLNPRNIINFIDFSCGETCNRVYEKKDFNFVNKWFSLVNNTNYSLYSLLKRFLKPKNELSNFDKYRYLFP